MLAVQREAGSPAARPVGVAVDRVRSACVTATQIQWLGA